MTPEPKTIVSMLLELSVRDPEKKYQFCERSGLNMSDGMSVEEADQAAYKTMFGIEAEL